MLTWPIFDSRAVDAVVTTRHGGVSSGPYATLNLGLHVGDSPAGVLENRRRAAAALGADLGDLVFCSQAHGRFVTVVSAADRGRGSLRLDDAFPGTDALVTSDVGAALVVMVADCVPIVLYDPAAHVLACVHAGWRGTVARVADATLAAMASLGSRPRDVLAGLGPAIAPDSYQVGEEVAAEAGRCFAGDVSGIISPDGSGRWLFDLWAANRRILREAGLPDGQIQVAALPTGTGRTDDGPTGTAPTGTAPADGTGPGRFFSDREARPCGRFAAIARLRPRGDS